MATVVVRRPARRPAPDLPGGELLLEAPPEVPEPGGRQWAQMLMVLPMVAMMGAMMLMFSGSIANSLRYVIFGLFGLAMVGMIVVAIFTRNSGAGKVEMGQARRTYLRHLAQQRLRLGRSISRQRDTLHYLHPEPGTLWSLAGSYRLWERRQDDADFGVTRIGIGRQGPATTIVPPDTQPLERLEPLSALALRRFVSTYATVSNLPLAIAVTGFARIYLPGDENRSQALARAMVAQLATLHAPDNLRIAVCASAERREDWDWVKWLPHALHPERSDALGPLRLIAPSITALEAMLDDLLTNRPRFDPDTAGAIRGPHLVVVLDGGDAEGSDHLLAGPGLEGVTVLDLTFAPPRAIDPSAISLDVDPDGTLHAETMEGAERIGDADTLDLITAEGLARQLAPLRLTAGAQGEQPLSADLGLADLLDLGDPYDFDPEDTWVPRPSRDRLRVRFGLRSDGQPIEIDLKESAQEGMGPHGLLIGATGSGKSELLRTLVLALAITHPPRSLNFALVDFKGGATFTRLDKLPHTSAVITNLAEELHLVDRMADAINGELLRRQELLRAAGNFSSLRDYEKARAAGAPLEEVPTLLVICDEFSELLTARPDFIDMFVQIGRVGRSLGVHLLLASQRLDEGRLRGLEAHLSFRIGLRTFSDIDSRTVLGVNDAFLLPRAPGHGYLRVGTEQMDRFRSAYVSGVHRRAVAGAVPMSGEPAVELLDYSSGYVTPVVEDESEEPAPDPDGAFDESIGETLMDVLVDRFEGKGSPAHQIWLPPLDEAPALGTVLPTGPGGPAIPGFEPGRLKTVVGIVDRPLEQRRDPLIVDLSAGGGHVAVSGSVQSGKSTTLVSLITSLALTHSPKDVQFYCLDFGGGVLTGVRNLPHVGSIAGRQDGNAVRRSVIEVLGIVAEREKSFAQLGIDSMETYRERRRQGDLADQQYGDVFLVIDGWSTIRNDFEDLEPLLVDIATRGLAYGVHLMVSVARWFDLRTNVRDLCGTKLELRIGDPIDSLVDRRAAAQVPERSPGRGLNTGRHHFLIAAPRLREPNGEERISVGLADLVRTVAAAWPDAKAPEVRLLPADVPYEACDGASSKAAGLAIGVAERSLEPVLVDPDTNPTFLLLGDTGSGKTGFLKTLSRRIAETYTPDEACVLVVDHRRSLLGSVEGEHLLGYGTGHQVTTSLINRLVQILEERLPGPDVTPQQLRDRSWWQGPDVFVLIDDYDMVATGEGHPLMPLLPYIPQAADIGLRIYAARRTGGAMRGLLEPVLAKIRAVGSPGLQLSGSRDEGILLGGLRAQPLPPGRGFLVNRQGTSQLVQLTHPPADHDRTD
ncbi:S-DNA-T family DNA segregation ATPase FtsK/SpoIIIE [Kribbella amoyensis]|uniref:S-DNA-T family DNA segregation ATPase FtsK/SpoIIIE n=1 Tax=Kribbella amoyensis TaxID=996641 RepID=A0A561BRB6_9ACTN|nr:type VII secretion protein EccCa [Kribbella amoyensis]TWD81322.1 S-DNA-T family DNA segregation ATPase FtsK/SpoIIIE [Kribbella amoyensis]